MMETYLKFLLLSYDIIINYLTRKLIKKIPVSFTSNERKDGFQAKMIRRLSRVRNWSKSSNSTVCRNIEHTFAPKCTRGEKNVINFPKV